MNNYRLSHRDYIFVNSDAQLAKYLKDGYEFVQEVLPESNKEDIKNNDNELIINYETEI